MKPEQGSDLDAEEIAFFCDIRNGKGDIDQVHYDVKVELALHRRFDQLLGPDLTDPLYKNAISAEEFLV